MDADKTLAKIGKLGLIAVVRGASQAAALEVSDALVEGGVTGIEIAHTTPEAHRVIEDLDSEYGDGVLLGAGTVTKPEQVEKSVAAKATFLVSPGLDPDLLPSMKETGLAVMPGVLTPSEIMVALHLGMNTVKVFPGSLGGPSYIKSLRGPFPEASFVPTGGVSLENIGKWFAAGAFAVGVGSALAPPTLEGRERSDVVARARKFAEAIRTAAKEHHR